MVIDTSNAEGISFLSLMPLCATLRGRQGERITNKMIAKPKSGNHWHFWE